MDACAVIIFCKKDKNGYYRKWTLAFNLFVSKDDNW